MPYHYEVSYGVPVQSGPDDVDYEEEIREFESMGNAIAFAKNIGHGVDDVKLFLVFQDVKGGMLRDMCELPLKLA